MTEQISSNETRVPLPISTSPLLSAFTFKVIDGNGIDNHRIDDCAKLFSANYGVWGELAGPSLSGKRVKMSSPKLRKQCLPIPQSSVVAVCFDNDKLLGHAFGTVWRYDGGTVLWITQLVVDATVRKRGIATQLLRTFKQHRLLNDVTAIGLASSHPASVTALANYSNVPVNKIDFAFMKENATKILDSSPVDYIKSLKPCGSLFEEGCTTGNVSSLFTQFFVDHQEPLDALNVFKANGRWCLGDLPEGHEFLIVIPVAST